MPHSEFSRSPRRFWVDGALYLVRDVWQRPAPDKRGRFVRCEYATLNPNGSKKWTPCKEGVEFATIKPARHRRLPQSTRSIVQK